MSDRAVLKEKNSSNKNGEAHHHHGQAHHSQKEEKDARSSTKALVENSADTFLKRYKVMEKIGEGSYSEVLKCQNRQDGTLVACKRLKHIYKSWSDVNNIAEIATLRTIQRHSNILQMIEIHYDETLGKVSLVFELMDVNLYELIKDRKRLLPESRVRTIMFQLFRALRHLHKLGIFHRDIKPENILIKTKTDQLKLGDLGSVRGMFSRPPYTEYISTRWYRSPECLLTAGHYSHKMDIWAAGCVFYEVLTLRPLFPGSSEIDQINRINNILGPPPIKLLETFQKQAEMERDTYRGQSQLNRRQQIQKVLDDYSSKYMLNDSKNSSNKSIKSNSRNSVEYHFSGREGTGLEKILPSHISREAKEIIKTCLSYDPELRPTAQRVIQLSYFYELRESYNKNPEKVSSKPVLTICGETITEQHGTIDLGTLGDNKMKYRRGHAQRTTKQSSSSYSQSKQSSKLVVDKKSSSHKDVNNNYAKLSSSPNDNSVLSRSRSKLSNLDGRGMSKSSKVLTGNTALLVQKDRKSSVVDHNNNKISSRRSSHVTVNHLEGETVSKIPTSKMRSSKNHLNLVRKHKKGSTTNSSSSFESVHSDEKSKYKYKFNAQQQKPGEKSSAYQKPTAMANQMGENQLSPYVKAPSELKFLQKKIKNDQTHGRKQGGGGGGQANSTISPMKEVKVPGVPPKVAAAALKFAKTQQGTRSSQLYRQSQGERGNAGGSSGVMTPTEETASVKIGKLRFRHKQQVPPKQVVSSPDDKPLPPQASVPAQQQRSRIPLYIDDQAGVVPTARSQSKQAMYRTTKLTSPGEKDRDATTDKWRNTGIPRIVMSPERERNIRLLRESLTIDKNKRLKIRRLEQDAMNSNNDADVESNMQLGAKTTPNRNPNFDYTSQDTIASSNGQRPGGHQRITGATYSSGRYRNSTTDYENPDLQDTSSSAAAPAPDARNMYVGGSARKRMVIPPEDMMKKSAHMNKKSSNLYPPEILNLYSSRFRGPDVNMNILKDQGSYVKHSDRTQDVKEKLNQKLELRRRQQLNSSSIGDHPSKLVSERSSVYINEYGQYSTTVTGGTIPEDQGYSRSTIHTGNKTGRIERRPPIPPGKVMGMRSTEPTDPSKPQHLPYHDPSEENIEGRQDGRTSYQNARRSSMIPCAAASGGGGKENGGQKSSRRSMSNVGTADQIRKEFKEQTKRRVERMRSTMRDDVFCSSDDDVVISMRKKFDVLISERARKLSESLKSNPSENKPQDPRKYYDSDEDAITPPINSRAKNTANEKARKYARRELRARMAESLTMNNLTTSNHWRLSEHRAGPMLIENPSNNSGDYVVAAPSYEKGGAEIGNKKYQPLPQPPPVDKTSYSHHQGYMRQRKDLASGANNNDYHREKYMEQQSHSRQPPVSSRIYPFSRHEQNSRHGQIYTPPGNKPVYQAPDVGAMLHERKLRYSHNLPVPISNSQSNYSQRGRNIKEDMKKRQRI